MRRWALRLLSAAVCAGLALVAATTASPRSTALEYPNTLTGPLKGDCTGGWDYHLAIGSVTWTRAPGGPYDLTAAGGVSLSSRQADGTTWTLDSSKKITGKLLFQLPATQPAYALVSVPATRHYPTGGTTDDDQGLGFGSTGTITADASKGTLVVAFDRKFTIAAVDNIPASSCEFTGTFTGAFEACKKEKQLLQFAQEDFDAAKGEFVGNGRRLEAIEDAPYRFLAGPLSGLLASAAMSQMERHDEAAKRFEHSADKFKRAGDELAKAKKALDDCVKGTTAARARSLQASAKRCTDKDWAALTKRARRLRLQKLAPRARTIAQEVRAGRRAQAAGDLKVLRTAFKGERKRVDGFGRALRACA